MRAPAAAVLLAAAVPVAAQAPAKPPVLLGDIRFQLYYELSGMLSPPVGPKFSFWNTGAGEGDAKEPASNFLITVPLRSTTGDAVSSDTPVVLTIRTAAGKVIATRTSKYDLVPYQGQTYVALWVVDQPCMGKVVVTATYGKQVRRAGFSLDCGE